MPPPTSTIMDAFKSELGVLPYIWRFADGVWASQISSGMGSTLGLPHPPNLLPPSSILQSHHHHHQDSATTPPKSSTITNVWLRIRQISKQLSRRRRTIGLRQRPCFPLRPSHPRRPQSISSRRSARPGIRCLCTLASRSLHCWRRWES